VKSDTENAGYNPRSAPSLQHFNYIKMHTNCPYAASARLWGCPEWLETASLENNVKLSLPSFLHFAKVSRDEQLDGYVFEAIGEAYGSTVERLADTTRRVLTCLSEHDPAQAHCMQQSIERPDWHFSVAGERFFVITFAPCYGSDNSRYAFGVRSTFILFQTDHSFDRRVPPNESRIPDSMRNQVRVKFAAKGRPYDLRITLSRYEAYRYVKPMCFGDPVIKWWKTSRS
jgi:hypothetical protein